MRGIAGRDVDSASAELLASLDDEMDTRRTRMPSPDEFDSGFLSVSSRDSRERNGGGTGDPTLRKGDGAP